MTRYESGPSRGMRDAQSVLQEVPWGGGSSNVTQLTSSVLGPKPAAALKVAFKPIEVVESECTVSRTPDHLREPDR